jgi:hypothetical protein
MVISSYAVRTCFGNTELANDHQVPMAWNSGLYCPSNYSDINANVIENHLLSKQYCAFKTHLNVMINLKKEVQQQVESECKTWSLWMLFQSLTQQNGQRFLR